MRMARQGLISARILEDEDDVTTSGGQEIQEVSLEPGDVVILAAQDDEEENRAWRVSEGDWLPVGDAGMAWVEEGREAQTLWVGSGGSWHAVSPPRVVATATTTESITLEDEQEVDGVNVVEGDVVLVRHAGLDNGLYLVVAADEESEDNPDGEWTPIPDMGICAVTHGDDYANVMFMLQGAANWRPMYGVYA